MKRTKKIFTCRNKIPLALLVFSLYSLNNYRSPENLYLHAVELGQLIFLNDCYGFNFISGAKMFFSLSS